MRPVANKIVGGYRFWSAFISISKRAEGDMNG